MLGVASCYAACLPAAACLLVTWHRGVAEEDVCLARGFRKWELGRTPRRKCSRGLGWVLGGGRGLSPTPCANGPHTCFLAPPLCHGQATTRMLDPPYAMRGSAGWPAGEARRQTTAWLVQKTHPDGAPHHIITPHIFVVSPSSSS